MQLLKSIDAPLCTRSVWLDVGLVIRTHTGHVFDPPKVAFDVAAILICVMPTILMMFGLKLAVADTVTVLLVASYVAVTDGVIFDRLKDVLNSPAAVDWSCAAV